MRRSKTHENIFAWTFDFHLFLSVDLSGYTMAYFSNCGHVSFFKALFWQRIDIAFHSATHSVTRLPFAPQGLLSWELACQPETMWRVRGVRFDWDMEKIEEERGGREGPLWGYQLKWGWLPCRVTRAKVLSFFLRYPQRSYYLLAALNELFC